MADESDGIDEALEGMLRVGLTAAGRLGEVAARAREQAARQARSQSEAQARELAARLQAERAAGRAQLAPVARGDWWDTARPDDIAGMWETAVGWRALDPEAERAASRIRNEVRQRYGVDLDVPGADPAAVRAALERRGRSEPEMAGEGGVPRRDEAEAAALLEAADRVDRAQQADAAVRGGRYDTPERRQRLAETLSGVVDPEAVTARVLADVAQARPAGHAVAARPQPAPGTRRSGPPGPDLDRSSSLGR